MFRHWWVFLVIGLVLVFMLPTPRKSADPDSVQAVCHGPPLASVAERNAAMEQGYAIHPVHQCIEQASWLAVEAQRVAYTQASAERGPDEHRPPVATAPGGYLQARRGFRTRVQAPEETAPALPQPPTHLFLRSDYQNPQGHRLVGYISPDPADGRRHPAILWLSGGDTNSLGDFWTPGPDADDQSARAFREAGIIMAFVALRGGNGHRSQREYFLGEVDDVLAATRQLASIRYVDPARIYLGGHSTGATLALLVAAADGPYAGVFAFGPVASVDRYPNDRMPVDLRALDPLELKLRSPVHWLDDIRRPTWIIEGVEQPANLADLIELCEATGNPAVRCLRVPGADHHSVLRPATRVIAERIAAGASVEFESVELSPQ